MVRASALYIVIIMALVIAVICSSLIVSAYFYKEQYQRKFRYDLLTNNLTSGINIVLAGNDKSYTVKKIDLFSGAQDSVLTKRIPWGIYDIGIVKAFIKRDTLQKIFSIAGKIDSLKWATLYLIDEDRPLSVSGKTSIRGSAFIPKAGVKEAYVDDHSYEGDKRLVIGTKRNSDKTLPVLKQQRLDAIENLFELNQKQDDGILKKNSFSNSFDAPLKFVDLKKVAFTLNNKLSGYLLIRSDTTITIDSTSKLNDVIICAPSVNIKEGFHGKCQIFATDSIHLDKNVRLGYPSVLGIVQFVSSKTTEPGKITISAGCVIKGTLFTYQKEKSATLPIISFAEHNLVAGQIYSQGIINYKKNLEIDGSVFTSRFIYQSAYTRYENYLIDVTLNSAKLPKYYLTSTLLPVSSEKQNVLQWLR